MSAEEAAATPAEPIHLRRSSRIILHAADPLGPFDVTQADVTFQMVNHATGRQELNLVLVLERDIPAQGDPR